MDWFIGLLLGHLTGDYILQNSWMALNKKQHLSICMLHCAVYTFCVCAGLTLFNVPFSLILVLGIYLSHIVLDATSLVDKWMKFYGITSFTTCIPSRINNDNKEIPDWDSEINASQIVQTMFGTICYVVIDNTLHLIMMVLFIKYIILGI